MRMDVFGMVMIAEIRNQKKMLNIGIKNESGIDFETSMLLSN